MQLNKITTAMALAGALGTVALLSQAQEIEADIGVQHAECALFGPEGEQFRAAKRNQWALGALTAEVAAHLGTARTKAPKAAEPAATQGTIDTHIFKALSDAGVVPAPRTSDYEFIRRASLDLVGRVPSYDRLVQFISDSSPSKRAAYIDELLASPEWIDKWTMYFGDFFENSDNNTQVRPYPQGRNAYHNYFKQSLAANKRYDAMVRELISATGDDSWVQGELQWFVLGFMGGGPTQDIADLQAANAAEKFLGLSHENCILCHDGRRHLDGLSYWGISETRREAWELASFFAKSQMVRVPAPNAVNGQPYYYRVLDRTGNVADYALNTTTGNRPPRQPIGTLRNIAPRYPFADGGVPRAGEPYRVALARLITSDIQFARASVNYFWKQFYGRGIVDPPNQFDPDRLDPAKPPPEPWTIQPSHPALLDALAKEFQQNGFDLKWLMRTIANSDAYQLSARYDGTWKYEYERLFARKLVRRLWGEEVVDAIAQTSFMPVLYTVNGGMDSVPWAMQLPQTRGLGAATVPIEYRLPGIATTYPNASLLDAFLRGNRIEEERRQDGSVAQVLNLMNDRFVHDRTRALGAGNTASLARRVLNKYTNTVNNNLLVNELFLTVLSRPATEEELRIAQGSIEGTTGTVRQQRVEDLLWALYNKVDFIYNY
jgi:hypothetical protein